uniref:Methylcrotonoyl-CoA carboxylase subunit alpha, mitochondrial n=1 Tax=Panagrellus redivivus TaxID=6233 RepID=A0A7E4VDH3_PANRE
MHILHLLPRHGFILGQIRYNHATGLTRINKVVIANRGEIAMRVLKTARRLGIETVAVFSDADANSLHTRSADQAFHIGQASPLKSYLRMDALVDVAKKSGAQAIHPGYGFLSENPEFAELCAAEGIIFMGPPANAIRDMGMKNTAKKIMIEAGVPVIEGYNGDNQEPEYLFQQAKEIGFPVMMKAVRGGGGKGMRIAWSEKDFFESLESAKSESSKAFGDDAMIIEKFVERPRHVEVQVFGDQHDNYVYLWERDCSIQRRHQKIIEEAPAPGLSMETRHRLGKAAVDAARAVKYVGAGTVEFIMDPRGDFYFMEMNTRLQVEHPISEAITGIDLVEWQFRAAQGETLPKKQADITLNGHALEARVYAEDSKAGFMPTAGLLEHLSFPTNARIDSGVEQGDFVTVHYDPMIAKVIVHGADRNEAISRLDAALANTHIGGLCNNVGFVRTCLNHPEFVAGNVYTDFIQDHEKELLPDVAPQPSTEALAEGVVGQILVQSAGETPEKGPFHGRDYFRLNYSPSKTVKLDDKSTAKVIISQGNSYKIIAENHPEITAVVTDVEYTAAKPPTVAYSLEVDGKRWKSKAVQLTDSVVVFGSTHSEYPVPAETTFDEEAAGNAAAEARAPMPGVIEKVLVQAGESVTAGQALIVMIAMKMEYVIRAPFDCVVEAVNCEAGKNVAKNTVLAKYALPEEK